ncbi:MAG TPA: ABC transporter ATP-binding protein [Clostridiales bacterium]|nr:ABC transporter ATP-binding protein [Clostridiales bacterium]
MGIIKVKNLVKRYNNSVSAVNDISFEVEQGQLFAFLGRNGAGKSTTINIICTTLSKTSGEVLVNGLRLGKDDEKIRHNIGVVFQNGVLDKLLTVKENIITRASFYNLSKDVILERLDAVVELLDMKDFVNRRYGKLSGGQKRKADIARAIINRPKILFLDEPTTGLDPATRIKVWEIIDFLRKNENMTIFLTTHYMEEADKADNIAIIEQGKIIIQGTPNQLKEKYSSNILKVMPKNGKEELKEKLSDLDLQFEFKVDQFIIKIQDSMDALRILQNIQDYIKNFEVLKGNMDNVFLNVTGQSLMGEQG